MPPGCWDGPMLEAGSNSSASLKRRSRDHLKERQWNVKSVPPNSLTSSQVACTPGFTEVTAKSPLRLNSPRASTSVNRAMLTAPQRPSLCLRTQIKLRRDTNIKGRLQLGRNLPTSRPTPTTSGTALRVLPFGLKEASPDTRPATQMRPDLDVQVTRCCPPEADLEEGVQSQKHSLRSLRDEADAEEPCECVHETSDSGSHRGRCSIRVPARYPASSYVLRVRISAAPCPASPSYVSTGPAYMTYVVLHGLGAGACSSKAVVGASTGDLLGTGGGERERLAFQGGAVGERTRGGPTH
ncbi:hypothetical protein B0H11DRAFT_1916328 [Mycena galericulata]|nr:hypothetical protein B0H11DRAFT_1916328 [Mycena galericulata]